MSLFVNVLELFEIQHKETKNCNTNDFLRFLLNDMRDSETARRAALFRIHSLSILELDSENFQ